jgi:hypothetical protein
MVATAARIHVRRPLPHRSNALLAAAAVGRDRPTAFPLVKALMVGATVFEPVTPSVSGGSGQLATPRAPSRHTASPQLEGGTI